MKGIYSIEEQEGKFVKEEEVVAMDKAFCIVATEGAGEEVPHILPHAGGSKKAVVFLYNSEGGRLACIVVACAGSGKRFGILHKYLWQAGGLKKQGAAAPVDGVDIVVRF